MRIILSVSLLCAARSLFADSTHCGHPELPVTIFDTLCQPQLSDNTAIKLFRLIRCETASLRLRQSRAHEII